jgi:hypothetical protein
MSEIFISYARSTEAEARQMAEALRGLGYGVWRDDELPAHRSFAEVIDERLRASKAVVVLWSADALKSEWVQSEADRARLEHKLVQVTVDGASPPMPFDRIQCVDLVGWKGDPATVGWRRVVESVSELVGTAPKIEIPEPVARPHAARRPGLGPARAGAASKPAPIRWAAALAVGALAIAIGVGGWWILARRSTPARALATPLVEVRALNVIGDDPALRAFAGRATDSIAAFLGGSQVRVVSGSSAPQGDAAKATLAFGGAVSSANGQLSLHLLLEDTRSGTTIWSGDYAQPAARTDALIDEAKGGAMQTVNDVRGIYGPEGLLLDPETTLLVLRGSEDLAMPSFRSFNDATPQFEQALARKPDSAVLRAAYATALWEAAAFGPDQDRTALLAKGRAEAERTIREHPDEPGVGIAYATLLSIRQLQAPHDWVGAGARLDAALKAAPEGEAPYGYACGFFVSVGRGGDSLHFCQRALSLTPHAAALLVNYAQAQDFVGQPQVADELLAEGAGLYPNFLYLRVYRFAREAFVGSPDRAMALMQDPDATPPVPEGGMAALKLLQKARKSGLASDADAAMAAMRHFEASIPADDFRFLFPMALGRLDEAYGVPDLQVWEADDGLMSHYTAPLRRDPRFWPIAAKAGLVRYWVTTNKWPDFCSDPTYPLDCRAEAKRVIALSPPAEAGGAAAP